MTSKIVAFANELDQRGYAVIPNAMLLDGRLSGNAVRMWGVLAFYARERDEAWPGQKRLGEHLGLTDRQARVYVRELEAMGWLDTTRRGQGKTNLYRLTIPSGLERKEPSGLSGSGLPTSSTERSTQEKKNSDARAEEVHSYYLERRGLGPRKLAPGTEKLMVRAFNAGFNVLDLHRAVDGLLGSDWHREHGQQTLSTIFKTGPGTESFEDRIQGFIDRGLRDQPLNGVAGLNSVPEWVRKNLRVYGEHGEADPTAAAMGRDAENWLRDRGQRAVWNAEEPPRRLIGIEVMS